MSPKRPFPSDIVSAIHKAKILGIKAGSEPHRFIGVWVVVAERRVFVRSWSVKPRGWYATFLEESSGAMSVDGREMPVRAVHTTSERLKDAVDRAYAEKYKTPAAMKYVRDLCGTKSRATTTELVPA
ncbi:MAG: DUF2255 family protein [Anaerolineae bacterium]|nr:DUF2255 family protein [Gemmatimonadaceae bacterium]